MQAPIAAFPKCYMDDLCVTGRMSLFTWLEIAATLGVDGVELYPGFFPTFDRGYLEEIRRALARHQLSMPMLCASPDFTQPDAQARRAEVERYKHMIDLVAFFDAPVGCGQYSRARGARGEQTPRTCRLLSGQSRPELSEDDGVAMVVECIEQVLPYAAERGVILALENHYKDNYWTYPEFALPFKLFQRIVDAIDSPWFGVNFDPSNAILAGEDPLVVLEAVKARVVSMHASDRHLLPGYTLEDLHAQEGQQGYAQILRHGEIGTGLNDYPAIVRILEEVDFHGWISIEDGVNGIEELRRSVTFVRKVLAHDATNEPTS